MLSLPNDNKNPPCPPQPFKNGGSWAYSLKTLTTEIQGRTKVTAAQLTWRTGHLSKGAYVSDADGTTGVITEIKPHVIVVTTTSVSGGEASTPESTTSHTQLTGRELSDQHPIGAVTGLAAELDSKADLEDGKVQTDQIPLTWIADNITVTSSDTKQFVAAENISASRFVAVNENQQIVRAGTEYPYVIGFITTAVMSGETATVHLSGTFTRQAWNFDINKPLMLSESGEPVQTGVQSILVYVGTVIDTHTFVMRLSIPTLILQPKE
jgi:hypothetical protein